MAEEKVFFVHSSLGAYEVMIADGAFRSLGVRLRALGMRGRLALITDSHIEPLWGDVVRTALTPQFEVRTRVLPPGESTKSLLAVEGLCRWLVAEKFGRSDAIVALGGGVVGDLAGFVASIYHRGIPVVQLPTTLLAQVDSAIGGKVAVDLPEGKNLVGSFHRPLVVVADTGSLTTLPRRERWNGLAEIVKTGLIGSAELVKILERELERIGEGAATSDVMHTIVSRTAEIKAHIVSADEFEHDARMLLNFGHTFGHALETATGHGPLLHGEAIVLGMRAATRLSEQLELLRPTDAARVLRLLARFPRPRIGRPPDRAKLLVALAGDKKERRFIALEAIGCARVVRDVPPALVEQLVDQLLDELAAPTHACVAEVGPLS